MVNLASGPSSKLVVSPDAPTMAELGVDFNADGYFMFAAPDGIPDAAREALSSAIAALAFAVVRLAGPLAAELTVGDYRPLRDEPPWKYIGFVCGGGLLIFGLMSLVERRLSLARLALAFAVAVAVALALALAHDLPFEDLLLPPNGDV